MDSLKMVVLDGYVLNPGDLDWAPLESLGSLTVYDHTDPGDIVSRIGDAEIIFTNKTPITAETLGQVPDLKFFGELATGYDNIDVAAAVSKGITVCNVPEYSTQVVAQFTLGLLLELCHHIGEHNDLVHQGAWQERNQFSFWAYPQTELAGKTAGLIGFGKIGQQTARIFTALGMQILYTCPSGPKDNTPEGCTFVQADEMFARADIISLHCPLFSENRHMICKESIRKMKDGVMILNTARGGLIDPADLAEALVSGKVGGAALDVAETEPMPDGNPLLGAPNCILTPHLAWTAFEARKRLIRITADNVSAFLNGTPVNTVAPKNR